MQIRRYNRIMAKRGLSIARPHRVPLGASRATALDEQPVILTPMSRALPPVTVNDQVVILEMPRAPPAVGLPEAPSEPEELKRDWSGYIDLLVCAVLLGGCPQRFEFGWYIGAVSPCTHSTLMHVLTVQALIIQL